MTTNGKAVDWACQISPGSQEFLIALFTGLRRDLDDREPRAVEERQVFDSLLTALKRGIFPDDEKLRMYVADLAEATDIGNEYERISREHKALKELVGTLSKSQRDRISSELIQQLNHPIRREVLRLLHEVKKPCSPQRMSAAFSSSYSVANIAYHVRTLNKGQLLTLVSERPVRGAKEKFFASEVSSHEPILSILADTAEDDASVRR